MKTKTPHSVTCRECKLTITENHTTEEIRKKLKAVGWKRKFICVANDRNVYDDVCAKCTAEEKNGHTCGLQHRIEGDLENMVSPYAIQ